MKSWSVFLLVCFFVVFNSLNYVQAKGVDLTSAGTKASTVAYGDIEAFIGVEHSKLTYGETETFVLSSKNYVGKVQYRIWLNKKDSKIWMDITGGYSEPVTSGTPLIVKYDKPLELGEYTVVAWVKIAGTNGSKKYNSGLGYDKYVVTNLQCIKSDEKANKTIYTALGDSIAFGLSAEQGKGYVDLLNNYLKSGEKAPEVKLTNLSMPGDKSSDLLAKLKNDTTIRTSVKESNLITISIGGNNLLSPLIQSIISEYKLDPKDPEFSKKLATAVATDTKLPERMASLLTS